MSKVVPVDNKILETLEKHPEGLLFMDIVRETDIPKSTLVNHLCGKLSLILKSRNIGLKYTIYQIDDGGWENYRFCLKFESQINLFLKEYPSLQPQLEEYLGSKTLLLKAKSGNQNLIKKYNKWLLNWVMGGKKLS